MLRPTFASQNARLNNLRAEGVPEDVVERIGARAIPDDVAKRLQSEGVAEGVLQKLKLEVVDEKYEGADKLMADLGPILGPEQAQRYKTADPSALVLVQSVSILVDPGLRGRDAR